MENSLLKLFFERKRIGKKSLAVLIDPDKVDGMNFKSFILQCVESKIDYFFIGGSLIMDNRYHKIFTDIKESSNIPTIIFPGNTLQIDSSADGILLLSLLSGRNPELLIGQHVVAAPVLKRSKLDILSTGYILIDGGNYTSVSYMSNTTPIPSDKPDIAACTAMAGEMIGHKLIYLDAGSGAINTVSKKTISKVSKSIDIPLIVGGGINTVEKARNAFHSGADTIVVGNALETNPTFLYDLAELVEEENKKVNSPKR